MVASALTALPVMPDLLGRENFNGRILYQREFGSSDVTSSSQAQCITIIGGDKASADMVYSAVIAAKLVTWSIRSSGAGPGLFL